ncbi:hypothetical protein D3C84_1119950 [compost metagenome]
MAERHRTEQSISQFLDGTVHRNLQIPLFSYLYVAGYLFEEHHIDRYDRDKHAKQINKTKFVVQRNIVYFAK